MEGHSEDDLHHPASEPAKKLMTISVLASVVMDLMGGAVHDPLAAWRFPNMKNGSAIPLLTRLFFLELAMGVEPATC